MLGFENGFYPMVVSSPGFGRMQSHRLRYQLCILNRNPFSSFSHHRLKEASRRDHVTVFCIKAENLGNLLATPCALSALRSVWVPCRLAIVALEVLVWGLPPP